MRGQQQRIGTYNGRPWYPRGDPRRTRLPDAGIPRFPTADPDTESGWELELTEEGVVVEATDNPAVRPVTASSTATRSKEGTEKIMPGPWLAVEKRALKNLLREFIERTKQKPAQADMIAITDKLNRKFHNVTFLRGRTMAPGTRFQTSKATQIAIKKRALPKPRARNHDGLAKDYVRCARPWKSVRAQIYRWGGMLEWMDAKFKAVNSADAENATESDGTDTDDTATEEINDNEDGSNSNTVLEDDSDDEDRGKRPASQPTGASLLSAET